MQYLESQHQIAVMDWAKLNPILKAYLFHPANEGKRTLRAGVRAKREGMKAGVSDLFLPYPIGLFHGCWLELKAPVKTAKLSPLQREWLIKMDMIGYCIGVCYGSEEAIKFLTAYLNNDLDVISNYRKGIIK